MEDVEKKAGRMATGIDMVGCIKSLGAIQELRGSIGLAFPVVIHQVIIYSAPGLCNYVHHVSYQLHPCPISQLLLVTFSKTMS